MKHISEDLKTLIIENLLEGKTQRTVSKEFKVAQTSISYIWKKYLRDGTVKNRLNPGRPLKSSERDRRSIIMKSKRNPTWTAKKIYDEVQVTTPLSIWSVRRILRAGGLFGRIGAKKPLLNKGHVNKRLKWCKAYQHNDTDFWRKVMFTDESKVELFSCRRKYVRRPIGTRLLNRYVCKTVRHGGVSLMVWGAILGDGSRILIKCPPRLDSVGYQGVIKIGLRKMYESDVLFLQDGAPCHRSKSTLTFLEREKVCYISDWPAQSPDLNIIENLWAHLKSELAKHCPKSSDELWNTLETIWYSIPNKIISDLYDSIPRRLQAVIKNRGLHTTY